MMRLPSVKTIAARLHDELDHVNSGQSPKEREKWILRRARLIRAEMENAYTDKEIDAAMDRIARIMGAHDTQAINGREGIGSRYWYDAVAIYVNVGETYATTVLYDTVRESWHITSWGDFLGKNAERYGAD